MALTDILTSRQLYNIQTDDRIERAPNWFLDTFFGGEVYLSDQEEILFGKLSSRLKMAPFVLPVQQGRPIWTPQNAEVSAFKPAYIKPKDAVRPVEFTRRQVGEVLRASVLGATDSIQSRYQARIVEILEYHRKSIERTKEWMAARAVLDGKVQVDYQADNGGTSHSVLVDFGRAAGHTVALGSGSRWGDSGVSILGTLETWSQTMIDAPFGGSPNVLVLGTQAAVPFRAALKDGGELKGLLDNNFRGSADVNLPRGLFTLNGIEQPLTRMGTLSNGLEVWVYRGQVQNHDGSMTNLMDPRDIALFAPGVEGIRCYGAILDEDAGLQAMDMFPKMWKQPDPSGTFIMTQSAPLMIPVNPNRTFRARVVA